MSVSVSVNSKADSVRGRQRQEAPLPGALVRLASDFAAVPTETSAPSLLAVDDRVALDSHNLNSLTYSCSKLRCE